MNVGVIILAAGSATRFGSDKRVARLPDGRRVIDATLGSARASGLPLLVCLRAQDHRLAAELVAPGITCLQCRRADEGLGGTLAEAIGHAAAWDGALVALADMPWIEPATYRAVARSLTADTICQPVFGDAPGHPVGFGAAFFGELAALGGDAGGRALLQAHPDAVRAVAVEDPAVRRDVDSPADLA